MQGYFSCISFLKYERKILMCDKYIEKAYNLYENDMTIINIITDDDYIDVSEFSQLLSTILNRVIKPKFINRILMDTDIIIRKDTSYLQKQKILGFKENKYTIISAVGNSCKEVEYEKGLFYLWKADFLFKLLGVDFKCNIQASTAETLCNIIRKYVKKQFDINQIHTNLQYLQFILKRECIYYK